jgi:hypothetical protein
MTSRAGGCHRSEATFRSFVGAARGGCHLFRRCVTCDHDLMSAPRIGLSMTVAPAAGRLVARAAEVAAVETFVSQDGGTPGALVLEGEPGVGKTSLWETSVRPDLFLTYYGPAFMAASRLSEQGRAALRSDLAALADEHGRAEGNTLVLDWEYRVVTAIRRGGTHSSS